MSRPSPESADRLLASISQIMYKFRVSGARQAQSARYIKYSPIAFQTLRWLDAANRPTPSGLAKFLDAPRPTVTSLLDRLEADNLIARAPSSRDRRKIELSLTARGQRAVAAIASEDRANCTEMLAPLSVAEREIFLDLLHRVSGGDRADDAPESKADAKTDEGSAPRKASKKRRLGRKAKSTVRPVMTTDRRKPSRKPR